MQVADPVVEPQHERKPEWWIFGKLEQALGLRSVFDAGEEEPVELLFARLDHMLASTGATIETIREAPSSTVELEPLAPGSFYGDVIQTEDGRVDCCPPILEAEGALARCDALFEQALAEPAGQLKLISKREPSMHNSWYQNLPSVRGRRREPRLWLHPEDAAARGIAEGQRVRVANEWGAIEVDVAFDAGLVRGAAALPHGAGNVQTAGAALRERAARRQREPACCRTARGASSR